MIFMPSTKNVIRFNEKCLKVLTMYNWQVGHDTTTNNSHVFWQSSKIVVCMQSNKVLTPSVNFLSAFWSLCFNIPLKRPSTMLLCSTMSMFPKASFKSKFLIWDPPWVKALKSMIMNCKKDWIVVLTKTYFIKSGIKVCPILKAAVAKAFVILGSISLL